MKTLISSPGFRAPSMRHCGETEPIPPLKAFVAFDDLAAGHRAVAVLRKRLPHSDEPVELKPVLWRFDLLTAAAWRDLAAADTIDSEMIVISTSEADAVPASIDAWVATCLARLQFLSHIAKKARLLAGIRSNDAVHKRNCTLFLGKCGEGSTAVVREYAKHLRAARHPASRAPRPR